MLEALWKLKIIFGSQCVAPICNNPSKGRIWGLLLRECNREAMYCAWWLMSISVERNAHYGRSRACSAEFKLLPCFPEARCSRQGQSSTLLQVLISHFARLSEVCMSAAWLLSWQSEDTLLVLLWRSWWQWWAQAVVDAARVFRQHHKAVVQSSAPLWGVHLWTVHAWLDTTAFAVLLWRSLNISVTYCLFNLLAPPKSLYLHPGLSITSSTLAWIVSKESCIWGVCARKIARQAQFIQQSSSRKIRASQICLAAVFLMRTSKDWFLHTFLDLQDSGLSWAFDSDVPVSQRIVV